MINVFSFVQNVDVIVRNAFFSPRRPLERRGRERERDIVQRKFSFRLKIRKIFLFSRGGICDKFERNQRHPEISKASSGFGKLTRQEAVEARQTSDLVDFETRTFLDFKYRPVFFFFFLSFSSFFFYRRSTRFFFFYLYKHSIYLVKLRYAKK